VAGQESSQTPRYLSELERKLQVSGGEAPLPERLSSPLLAELRHLSGNEQLLKLAEAKDELKTLRLKADERAELICRREDHWQKLKRLLRHNRNAEHQAQAGAILASRQLLQEPNPVQPLANEVMNELRADLNRALQHYRERYDELMDTLTDHSWLLLPAGCPRPSCHST